MTPMFGMVITAGFLWLSVCRPEHAATALFWYSAAGLAANVIVTAIKLHEAKR
jgi:hypothetical protein